MSLHLHTSINILSPDRSRHIVYLIVNGFSCMTVEVDDYFISYLGWVIVAFNKIIVLLFAFIYRTAQPLPFQTPTLNNGAGDPSQTQNFSRLCCRCSPLHWVKAVNIIFQSAQLQMFKDGVDRWISTPSSRAECRNFGKHQGNEQLQAASSSQQQQQPRDKYVAGQVA